jgi:transposase
MPSERVSMYRIREVLRLSAAGLTVRQVAAGARLSVGAVSKYLNAARASGVAWPVPQEWDDAELERRVYGEAACRPSKLVMPACAAIHQELKRHRHVTLQLLWEEYRAEHGPAAYSYSEFCTHYRRWKRQSARSMRQRHIAGEKLFIDYAGTQVPIYGAHSEPVIWASVFVAVWGASNYTYAEATRTQSLPDWLGSHVRALTASGGAPAIFVPDNPKVGVTKADRYEPILQRSYDELARHYGAVVIPARPFRPRDKPKVEQGVLLVSRWVLARLRHRRFFSLEELNTAIAALMVELNERPFKRLPGNRREAFETLDRPAMKPLPATPYEYALWKRAKVGVDYHLEVERHYYSVPHTLVGQEVEVRFNCTTVECFHHARRIAVHARSYQIGQHTTIAEHMPKSHQKHAEWSPSRLIGWAGTIGPSTQAVVTYQLTHKPHPEQGYRACLGLLALAKQYGPERLEAVATRAVAIGSPSRQSVKSLLERGLDRGSSSATDELALPLHGNVRGPGYYH